MGDPAKVKVTRGQRKATLARLLGTIERHIIEENVELVETKLDELKAAFDNLEITHDEYNGLLQDKKGIRR